MKAWHVAFAALTPLAAGAQAQTAPGLYGVLDGGVVFERGCDGCAGTRVASGVASGSRLGLTGREMLGGATAAVFRLEAGILNDTGRSDQDGRLFGRLAYLGLDGPLGALTLGRLYNLQYLALADVADPFKGGMAGNAGNLVGYTSERYDNAILYLTPKRHGLIAGAIYSFGEAPYSSAANRAYGASLAYAGGALRLTLAHQRKNGIAGGTPPASDSAARNTLLAANLHLGPATAYVAYGVNRGEGSSPWDRSNPTGLLAQAASSTDSRDVLLGVSVPRGATTYLASYIRKDDRSGMQRDATQFAVGMTYALSPRTDFYASYAKIRNAGGAAYTVGNATETGRGDAAFNVGLRHAF